MGYAVAMLGCEGVILLDPDWLEGWWRGEDLVAVGFAAGVLERVAVGAPRGFSGHPANHATSEVAIAPVWCFALNPMGGVRAVAAHEPLSPTAPPGDTDPLIKPGAVIINQLCLARVRATHLPLRLWLTTPSQVLAYPLGACFGVAVDGEAVKSFGVVVCHVKPQRVIFCGCLIIVPCGLYSAHQSLRGLFFGVTGAL